MFRPVKMSEFKGESSPEIREQKAAVLKKNHGKARPPKPQLSPGEIRAKVDELKSTKMPAGTNLAAKKIQYEEQVKKGEDTGSKVPTDVALNDPKDPMTSEKLKGALSSGLINFSSKEKEVLAQILGE